MRDLGRREQEIADERDSLLSAERRPTGLRHIRLTIASRTVGAIVARVWADAEKTVDRFANLRRIGIEEISYKRHHKCLTVVVDHDTGRLVWAALGRGTATLGRFFDALGAERAADHGRSRRRAPMSPPMPRTGSPTW